MGPPTQPGMWGPSGVVHNVGRSVVATSPNSGLYFDLIFRGYRVARELFFSTNCFYSSKISNYLCKILLIGLTNCIIYVFMLLKALRRQAIWTLWFTQSGRNFVTAN